MWDRWLVMKLSSRILHKKYVFNQLGAHGKVSGMFPVYVALPLVSLLCRLWSWKTDQQGLGRSGGRCTSAPPRCRRNMVPLISISETRRSAAPAWACTPRLHQILLSSLFVFDFHLDIFEPFQFLLFSPAATQTLSQLAAPCAPWITCSLPSCIRVKAHQHSACERLAIRSPLICFRIAPASLITFRITG